MQTFASKPDSDANNAIPSQACCPDGTLYQPLCLNCLFWLPDLDAHYGSALVVQASRPSIMVSVSVRTRRSSPRQTFTGGLEFLPGCAIPSYFINRLCVGATLLLFDKWSPGESNVGVWMSLRRICNHCFVTSRYVCMVSTILSIYYVW